VEAAVTQVPEAQPAPLPADPPSPDGTPRGARVPILMYHYLSTPPAGADIYRRDLSVSPDLFAAHLDRLRAEGYTTITLYDLYQHLATGAALPEKPVILTFDDGYRDNFENAFPALRDRGMRATFFVVTDFMDEQRPEYLTWEMAREMLAGGMSIESHGRNHVSLYGKSDDYLVWQALGSLQTIEYELGVRPHFVSYPAGEYDQRTIDIFRSANYWAGVTTEQGVDHTLDDAFEWNRIRVRGTTSPDDLIRLLSIEWQ
jgi:peptidoglycan/xylan/chitin deacetylase (PgdA/CDA1 family)